MKHKKTLRSILIIIILLVFFVFFFKKYINTPISDISSNSIDLISITNLSKSDYDHIVENNDNYVYIFENGFQKQLTFDNNPIRSIELSPNGKQTAFFYESDNKSRDVLTLMVIELENNVSEEKYQTSFASWDVTNNLHWLGEDYIFFLRHCGTGCKGVTLLNLKSKETINAVLTYPSFSNQPVETHFKDWFGQEYLLQGIVNKISSKTINNKTYLIFDMTNDNGDYVGQNKLLFSGNSLTELNK
jgi:hypothetical protein